MFLPVPQFLEEWHLLDFLTSAIFWCVSLFEWLKILVPSALLPLTIFLVNWGYRHKHNYNQTAASDFILAILAFDGAVVAASEGFKPYINNEDLRSIVIVWHVGLACVGMWVWGMLVSFGEPRLAAHYKQRRKIPFPYLTYSGCWIAVGLLVSIHVVFFRWW